MKTLLTSMLAVAVMGTFATKASAGLLAYEPFTNGVGTAVIGSSGGYGFNGAWLANSSSGTATNLGYGLSYSDGANALQTSGGSAFFQGLTTANSSMQPVRLLNFARGTNASLANNTDGAVTWISFLIVRQGPTGTLAGNPFGRGVNLTHDMLSSAGTGQKIALGNSSGAAQNTVGILSGGGAIRPGTATFGSVGGTITDFVIAAVQHNVGGNDNAYLWVNPTSGGGLALGGADPGFGTSQTNVLGLFDYSFDRIRYFVGGQNNAAQPYAEAIISDYRIGETWADVTPITNVPEPVAGAIVGVGTLAILLRRRKA
jgi:hypothetical protein